MTIEIKHVLTDDNLYVGFHKTDVFAR